MFLGTDVDQLHRDPDAIARLPHSSLEGQANPEFLPDFTDRLRRPPILLRGPTGNDPKARNLGGTRDQLVGQPVGEVLIARVMAHVGERDHRQSRGRARCRVDRSGSDPGEDDPVDVHGKFDVLEGTSADLFEGEVELVPNLVKDGPRHADPARLGERLDPGGDIDRVAHDVFAIPHDVPDMNSDPEVDPLLLRGEGVSPGDRLLDGHRTSHRVHGAREFDEEAVPHRLHFTPSMSHKEGAYESLVLPSQQKRGLLVPLGELGEPDQVGEHDGRQPPRLRFHVPRIPGP